MDTEEEQAKNARGAGDGNAAIDQSDRTAFESLATTGIHHPSIETDQGIITDLADMASSQEFMEENQDSAATTANPEDIDDDFLAEIEALQGTISRVLQDAATETDSGATDMGSGFSPDNLAGPESDDTLFAPRNHANEAIQETGPTGTNGGGLGGSPAAAAPIQQPDVQLDQYVDQATEDDTDTLSTPQSHGGGGQGNTNNGDNGPSNGNGGTNNNGNNGNGGKGGKGSAEENAVIDQQNADAGKGGKGGKGSADENAANDQQNADAGKGGKGGNGSADDNSNQPAAESTVSVDPAPEPPVAEQPPIAAEPPAAPPAAEEPSGGNGDGNGNDNGNQPPAEPPVSVDTAPAPPVAEQPPVTAEPPAAPPAVEEPSGGNGNGQSNGNDNGNQPPAEPPVSVDPAPAPPVAEQPPVTAEPPAAPPAVEEPGVGTGPDNGGNGGSGTGTETPAGEQISGGSNNDNIVTGAGADRISGGSGNDTVSGGAGADRVSGGAGDDVLSGGDGADRVYGGIGNDTVDGGQGDDRISGGAGNDTVSGGEGADRVSGGSGDDVLSGGDGADKVFGGQGDDHLDGGAGNDRLVGGAGDDVLSGGQGDDSLKGGDGADTFIFNGDFGNDVVRDFSIGDGDQIDLSGAGISDFSSIKENATESGGNTTIHTDNGSITMQGVGTDDLTAEQFLMGESLPQGSIAADNVMSLDLTSLFPDDENPDTYEVVVSGVPDSATLSAGEKDSDRNWTMTLAQVVGLTIAIPATASAAEELGELTVDVVDLTTNEVVQTAMIDGDSFDQANGSLSIVSQTVANPGQTNGAANPGASTGGGNGGGSEGRNSALGGSDDADEDSERQSDLLDGPVVPGGGGAGEADVTVSQEQLEPEPAPVEMAPVDMTPLSEEIVTEVAPPEVVEVEEPTPEPEPEVAPAPTPTRNGAPTDLTMSGDTISENAANGTVVGTASATDRGSNETFSYTLTDDAGGRFAIDSKTGVVTVADGSQLDHEGADGHEITIQVTDSVGNTYSEAMEIGVSDVNEVSTDLSLDTNSVAENSANGTVVGTAAATDPDAGETFTYSLVDNTDGGFFNIRADSPFAIDANTGEITVANGSLLDFENADSHNVTIQVTDSAGNTYSEVVEIDVTNVNEGATDLSLDTNSVAENAANGTVVGTAAASDPDASETFTYSLTDNADGRFAIDSGTGKITVADGSQLDFEDNTSHNVTVRVVDSGGNTYDEVMALDLTNVNEASTDLSLDTNTVAENAANGTVVGTAAATDPDAGETFTYSLTDNAGGRFAIDSGTGVVTVADGSQLNHEGADGHNITIQVTDSVGNTYSEVMEIGVSDVNEVSTDLSLDTNSVAENAANGTVVGTASATDPDAGETFTYSLTDDADGRFAINSSTGVITVADGSQLDFESAENHNVTVRVTDSGGNTYDEVMALDLTNVNEVSTDLSLDTNTVAENSANGTVVGTASATDPDAGETFTYSLTDNAGGRFAIDIGTGAITVADGDQLDFESDASHNVTVRVTDSGGNTYDEVMALDLTNVNEVSTDLSLDTNTVAENTANGTVVGTASATDPDAGETFTYSLTDNADGRLAIDSSTGEITVADGSQLDFESDASHNVTIEITDSGGNTYDEVMALDLTNVNEAPTDIDFVGQPTVAVETGTSTFSGLTHSWELEGNATDSVGSDDGAITGATTVAGNDGNALSFDESGDYVTIPDVTMNNEFTVSFQFRVDDTSGTLFQYMYSHGDINGTDSLNIMLIEGSHGTDPNTMRTVMRDTDDTLDNFALDFDVSGVVGDGEWHTYTLTVESGVGSTVFLDGVEQNSDTRGGDSFDPSRSVYLGARQDLDPDRMFGGEMDSVQIYDRPLNDSEVNDLHNLLQETIADGTVVATASTIDPDAGESFTYALTDDAGGLFSIDANTGVVTTNNSGESGPSTGSAYTVTVETTDSGGLTTSEELILQFGTSGDDTIAGGVGTDVIYGGDGTDTIDGGAGDDVISGGAGDDTLSGDAGADVLYGGTGTDTARYTGSSAGVNVNLSTGTGTGGDAEGDTLTEIENLKGSNFDDTLTGDAGDNDLRGKQGDDILSGGGGDDAVHGGQGDDTLSGGTGDDTLSGGVGADVLDGGTGTDTASYTGSSAGVNVNLETGLGTGGDAQGDTLTNISSVVGSAYADVLTGNSDANTLDGGAGNDVLVGGAGNDTLSGGTGADHLSGGDGDDTFQMSADGNWTSAHYALNPDSGETASITGHNANHDVFVGGEGYDTLLGTSGNDTILLEDTYHSFQDGAETRLQSIEEINAGAGDDVVGIKAFDYTYTDDIVIRGGDGNDVLWSDAGDDSLYGDAGDDRLDGGAGDDLLVGGTGADDLRGGTGTDTASYADSSAGVNVNLHTGTATGGDAQGDTLSDIEAVIGSAHDDTVFGSDSGTTADLGAGNDTFDNNLGTSAQVDVIDGGAGNDTVYAGEGNDTLTGGTGDDVLWGEGGSDTFVFGSGDGNDFAAGGAGGGWTDAIQLQDSDGSAVDGGWTVTLTSGTQVSDDGSKITLSDDAEGTITLNDGSEIDFTGIENITY